MFFCWYSDFMTGPCPSTCGGGAGGGTSVDVMSTALLAVGFDCWRARPLTSVEGKGGTFVVSVLPVKTLPSCVEVPAELLKGRTKDRLESAVSEGGPCALE